MEVLLHKIGALIAAIEAWRPGEEEQEEEAESSQSPLRRRVVIVIDKEKRRKRKRNFYRALDALPRR